MHLLEAVSVNKNVFIYAKIMIVCGTFQISEMKLFIMHQQNCIQDLQIQNKELRAVIEGLVGSDDMEVWKYENY